MSNLLEQIKQLSALSAAATPGPWRATYSQGVTVWSDSPISGFPVADGNEAEDAAFIAAARNFLTPQTLALLSAALATPNTPAA